MDLFAHSSSLNFEPLAARMRPRNLDEFIGQEHILGKGRLLRRAITADQLSSLIFYGPPGTGKTTLARVIANLTKSRFIAVNAVLCGVKDIREAVAEAQDSRNLHGQRTILFVDEVHRWNKAQQDALLPWVENGTVILIGATTENPFFEVNAALVSRSRLFQLKPLTSDDLRRILEQALADKERGYGVFRVMITPEASEHLIKICDGDGRTLLNALELAVQTSVDLYPPPPGTQINVDLTAAEDSIQKKAVLYDKEGDYHYDTISAFIKSMRGSDPDAALYWAARMIAGGEDPRFLLRRMIVFASEDIGLADPNALRVAMTSAEAFERIGMPEGRFPLAQAILYLATAPKSNSAFGFFDALGTVEKEMQEEVPNHLRDGNRDKEGFGHGEGYLYPHSYREHWVAQQYLPAALNGRLFYKPSSNGYEAQIKDRVLSRREAQLAAAVSDHDEILIFSKEDKKKDQWLSRTLNRFDEYLLAMRDFIFEGIKITPYSSVLIPAADDSVLLWEAVRKCPHGAVAAVFVTQKAWELAQGLAGSVNEPERPFLFQNQLPMDQDLPCPFEWLLGNIAADQIEELFSLFPEPFAKGAKLSLALLRRDDGTRLSSLLPDLSSDAFRKFCDAEEEFYAGLRVSEEKIRGLFTEKGWKEIEFAQTKIEYGKFLPVGISAHWLSDKSPFGVWMKKQVPVQDLDEIQKALSQKENTVISWVRSLYRVRST